MSDLNRLTLANYYGEWISPRAASLPVTDPATGEILATVPLSQAEDVARAVQVAAAAFPSWRRTPPGDRIQHLFRLKGLLEQFRATTAKTSRRASTKS